MSQNWFLKQEAKWRSAASAIWTFLLSFCIVVVFLLLWIFSPMHHVINICNYFLLLFTLQAWFMMICISLLSAMLVKIHFQTYSVVCDLKTSRMHLLVDYFHPCNWFYALCYGILSLLIAMCTTKFSTKTYSIYTDCRSTQGTFRCLNEAYFVFIMFSFVLGFAHHLFSNVRHSFTLRFPLEQQERFLLFKVNLSHKLMTSARQSLNFLKYFILFYYVLGVIPRYFISAISNYPFWIRRQKSLGNAGPNNLILNLITADQDLASNEDLIGFNNFTTFVSVAWTLWIFGTLIFLLTHLSWHLFNSHNTKIFNFPVDSVFPEDDCRLLTANLSRKQPLLVQHLAFQYLSIIAKYAVAKRKQLFVMKFEKQGQRLLKWNVVVDECLLRIVELTKKLKTYQNRSASKSEISSPSSQSISSSQIRGTSIPGLRNRFLSDDTNVSQSNTSYFEVSAHNAAIGLNRTRNLDNSAFLNNSMVVPTPKLWNKQQKNGGPVSGVEDVPSSDEINRSANTRGSLTSNILESVKEIPVIGYFVKEIPDREVGNIFSNHYIYVWAIESVSLLVAASFAEDDYGFVQQRIGEVLDALLDLLVVLEKSSKLPVTSTNSASSYLLRQQRTIKAETKAAIYRITNTFSQYLDSLLETEHLSKLKGFVDQKE